MELTEDEQDGYEISTLFIYMVHYTEHQAWATSYTFENVGWLGFSWAWWRTTLILAPERQGQVDLCELKASFVLQSKVQDSQIYYTEKSSTEKQK